MTYQTPQLNKEGIIDKMLLGDLKHRRCLVNEK